MQNSQWKWCHRSLLFGAVFSVVCIYALYFIDGFSGGHAVAFVSFFLASSAAAVAALFFQRARVMDGILSSTQLLAHWTYSAKEALIADNGIIYEGAVYPFQSFLMRMDGAEFFEKEGLKPAVLVFSFTQSAGLSIRTSFNIEIPVPQGEEEKARGIAGRIAGRESL